MAQTQALKIFRETVLPAPLDLQPYSIYLIAPQGTEDYVEMYVTNSTIAGQAPYARRIINKDDIETLINTKIQAARELVIVDDIAARDELDPTFSQFVFVVDATADTTVATGGATYLYNTVTEAWIKISEAESLDVVVQWDSIQGGPTSTPAEIDDAVAKAHTHANKTELDKIGEDSDGNLLYSNKLPLTGWSSTTW
jgi:hypothetical protein